MDYVVNWRNRVGSAGGGTYFTIEVDGDPREFYSKTFSCKTNPNYLAFQLLMALDELQDGNNRLLFQGDPTYLTSQPELMVEMHIRELKEIKGEFDMFEVEGLEVVVNA